MKAAATIVALRERANAYWLARTEQERKFLAFGAAVALVSLVYALLLAPALEGRATLQRSLPALRLQASQLQSMAAEAATLAANPAPAPAPMTREALNASLAQRSLAPGSLSLTG